MPSNEEIAQAFATIQSHAELDDDEQAKDPVYLVQQLSTIYSAAGYWFELVARGDES